MTMDDPVALPSERTLLSSPSLACDLSWVLSVAVRPHWRPKFPNVSEHLERREDLAERVRTFWSDADHETCFTEMQVLAHYAGALEETSPTALWAALEGAISTVPTDIGLESESPEDRLIFLNRLERLKESPTLFRSYIDLLREVWEPIDEIWQPTVPMLREAGQQVVAKLESGRALGDVMGESCEIFNARINEITHRIDTGYPLLVIPCLFFGKSLYLEFPGLTVVGSGFQRNDAAARARTESLARRLKTVADPTRLALLHYLAGNPSTVGDLATTFGLAQPTVSMHMKSLRESGLVRSERKDGRMRLSADPGAVASMVDELRIVVSQGAGNDLASTSTSTST
jgi:ArsR family transcriptional regulator, arsenate/arsenite/antimonite-responsive transcriptional repressor